jgi:hypothetical protein
MIRFKKLLTLNAEGEGDAGSGAGGGSSNGGGVNGGAVDWKASLPEPVRAWDEVKTSDTPDKFWGQVSDMRSHLGTSIRIPGPDASQEAIAAFHQKLREKVPTLMPTPNPDDEASVLNTYKALGHPEKPEDYTVPTFTAPQGVQLDTSPIEGFRPIAHKYGLTKKQFEGIVNEMTQASIQAASQQQQAMDSEVGSLNTEWGHAFDQNYKKALDIAEKTQAPPALIDALRASKAQAQTVKWLHKLADAFRGEPQAGGDKNTSVVMTPGEAKQRVAEIMNNRQHPYWVADHPNHRAAMENMLELRKFADPNASTDINTLRASR